MLSAKSRTIIITLMAGCSIGTAMAPSVAQARKVAPRIEVDCRHVWPNGTEAWLQEGDKIEFTTADGVTHLAICTDGHWILVASETRPAETPIAPIGGATQGSATPPVVVKPIQATRSLA
jgi:hypothetical protein